MFEEELISVIIPVYNVQEYVERCVKSVIDQVYKNLEIILVDDGSTDLSGEICDRLSDADPRIKVIHQKNAGLAAARNAGLEIYSGEYVCFIDSDDYIHPEYVSYMYRMCIENNVQMAFCNSVTTSNDKCDCEMNPLAKTVIYDSHELLDRYFGADHGVIVVAWNKLIHRDVADGIRFEPGIIHEDEATTFKYIYYAGKVAYTDNVLYYYFSRADSITAKSFSIRNLDILEGYEKRLAFYKEKEENILAQREYNYYLSAILINYYKVYTNIKVNKKEVLKKLRIRYKRIYKSSDKTTLPFARRVIYTICLWFPLLFGKLRS